MTSAPTEDPSTAQQARRPWRMPSAFTILALVTVAVWLLAFLVPSGTYRTDPDTSNPVPGTYHRVPSGLGFAERLKDLFLAPVNGLYGVQNDKGFIGPTETGDLFGAVGVVLFVLAIGMFITVSLRTGAVDAMVGRLTHRFAARGLLLVAVLMFVFSVGGTTEGMAEETLGFYALLIPLLLRLGFDRLVVVGVIHVGAGAGVLASTVNPFATGVASGAAGISLGGGLLFRFVMYVVLTAVSIAYVVRYASRVRRDPDRSLVRSVDDHDPRPDEDAVEGPTSISTRQRVVLTLVGLTFAMLIFAIVPWAQVISGPDAQSYPWQLDWYFPELAALFVVMAVVIGLVGGLPEKGLVDAMMAGAGDFVAVGLIIALARGVTVVMNNAQITDTVLHSMEAAVRDTSSAVFGVAVFALNLPLAFLVPSTSGHATLAVPILAPLADFAQVSRTTVVTAFQSASGVVNLITPTSAVVMGGLALAKVRYDEFLRFVAPLLGVLAVLSAAFVAAQATWF